jgi:L-asparaginase/Glu-tRNA(Gln) amidotransferase subunit D
VGTTIRYAEPATRQNSKKSSKSPIRLKPSFNQKILVTHVTPGFPSNSFSDEMLAHLDALILIIFLSGTAPTHSPEFLQFLNRTKKRKLPVVLVTEGSAHPPNPIQPAVNYEAGKELLAHGCFWAGTMTPECTFVKTSLILGQVKGLKEFSRLWNADFAGEGRLVHKSS